MYQPVIQDELIRQLYRYAKAKKTPMTKALDGILREHFGRIEIVEELKTVQKSAKEVVYSLKE